MNEDERSIRQIVTAFEDAWNRHDMEAFAELFADDADFVNVVGMWWKGRSEIKAAHIASHETMFRNSRLSFRDSNVRFFTSDIAIVRSTWDLVGHVTPLGDSLPPRQGILTHVVTRQRGGWLIVSSQNTDIATAG